MTDLMPAEAVSEMRETPVGAAFESVQHGTEDLRRHVVGRPSRVRCFAPGKTALWLASVGAWPSSSGAVYEWDRGGRRVHAEPRASAQG